MRVLVTGGAGFIGSDLVRQALVRGHEILNYDALTYAANPLSLEGLGGAYHFVKGDVCDHAHFTETVRNFGPERVIHCAAETHVDRSIDHSAPFINTNIVGTHVVLDVLRSYCHGCDDFRLLAVSTDEVFGSLEESESPSTENSAYRPNSPYAASKAAADHLVRAYATTYGLPAVVTNCGNNYGPRQFPEKLIPHVILCAVSGRPIPVYGNGLQLRDWIHVSDHSRALLHLLDCGQNGQTYLVSAHNEIRNIDLVRAICAILDRLRPVEGHAYAEQIEFVTDRPGHDKRYALNAAKVMATGWAAKIAFAPGLEDTVAWYLQNEPWINAAISSGYTLERLGKARQGHT